MNLLGDTPPFFIVGDGRSGTTLLRACLSAHSRIAVPPETHYMKWADGAGAAEAGAPRDFDAAWKEYVEGRRFQDLAVEPQRVLELVEHYGGRTFKNLFAALLHAYAEKHGKVRAGEKTPGHYYYLDQLFEWFPQARVIAIRRDPRAVIASHLKSPWISQQLEAGGARAPWIPRLRLYHVAERARIWNEVYDRLGVAALDPRIHTIGYEDLVTHPERELTAIANFLGMPFEATMLQDRASVPGAASREQLDNVAWRDWLREHEQKATSPISTDGLEKWRTQLSRAEVALIEATCGSRMRRFGYEPEGGGFRPSIWLGRAALRSGDLEARARRGLAATRATLRGGAVRP